MHYIYSCTCNKKPFEFRSQDFLSILRKLKLEIVQISNGNAMCALRASCFRSPARHWHTVHVNQAFITIARVSCQQQTNYLKADAVSAARPLLHGGKQ